MFSSESSPVRISSSPRSMQYSKPQFSLTPLIDELPSKKTGGMILNLYSDSYPSPDVPSSAFKSPPASIIRSPSYGIRPRRLNFALEDKSIFETPKIEQAHVDAIIKGKPITPPPEPLNTLKKIIPIIAVVSLFLLFFIPLFAIVLCVCLVCYFIVLFLIKIEETQRSKVIPRIYFPSPSRK